MAHASQSQSVTERRSYEEMIVQALYKMAEVVLQSRVRFQPNELSQQIRERPHFNLDVEKIDLVRDKLSSLKDDICLEVRIELFTSKHSDIAGSELQSGVPEHSRKRMLLESWVFWLDEAAPITLSREVSQTTELRRAWDRITLFLRSMCVFVRTLPAFALYRMSRDTALEALDFVLSTSSTHHHSQAQQSSLTFSADSETVRHSFPSIETAIGSLRISVTYTKDLNDELEYHRLRLQQYDAAQEQFDEEELLEQYGSPHSPVGMIQGATINQEYVPRPQSTATTNKHEESKEKELGRFGNSKTSSHVISLKSQKPRWYRWKPLPQHPRESESEQNVAVDTSPVVQDVAQVLEPPLHTRTRSDPRAIPGAVPPRRQQGGRFLHGGSGFGTLPLSSALASPIELSPGKTALHGGPQARVLSNELSVGKASSAPVYSRTLPVYSHSLSGRTSLLSKQLQSAAVDQTNSAPRTALGLLRTQSQQPQEEGGEVTSTTIKSLGDDQVEHHQGFDQHDTHQIGDSSNNTSQSNTRMTLVLDPPPKSTSIQDTAMLHSPPSRIRRPSTITFPSGATVLASPVLAPVDISQIAGVDTNTVSALGVPGTPGSISPLMFGISSSVSRPTSATDAVTHGDVGDSTGIMRTDSHAGINIARRHSSLSERSDIAGTISQQSIRAPLWENGGLRRSSMSAFSISPFKDSASISGSGSVHAKTGYSGMEYSPTTHGRSFTPTPPLEPSSAPVGGKPSVLNLGSQSRNPGHWRTNSSNQASFSVNPVSSSMRSSYSLRRTSATHSNPTAERGGPKGIHQEIISYIQETAKSASVEDVVPWVLHGVDHSNPFGDDISETDCDEQLVFGAVDAEDEQADKNAKYSETDPLARYCTDAAQLDLMQDETATGTPVDAIHRQLENMHLSIV